MNKLEISEIRKHYDNMRKIIIESFSIDRNVDVDGDATDQVQGASIYGVQEQLSKRDLLRLRNIDAAIKRMDEGSFGVCEECEEDIGVKRLIALPGVKLCISCAEQIELCRRSNITA
jgi:DnaK suppressor protein